MKCGVAENTNESAICEWHEFGSVPAMRAACFATVHAAGFTDRFGFVSVCTHLLGYETFFTRQEEYLAVDVVIKRALPTFVHYTRAMFGFRVDDVTAQCWFPGREDYT